MLVTEENPDDIPPATSDKAKGPMWDKSETVPAQCEMYKQSLAVWWVLERFLRHFHPIGEGDVQAGVGAYQEKAVNDS